VLQRLRTPLAQRLIGLAISLVCAGAVAWWITLQDAPTWPDAAHLPWIGAALVADAVTYLLRGWRWHHIMHLSGIEHRRSDALAITLVGYMGNNVLPARGGELLRIGLMHSRSSARRREILGSIVAERLLDGAVLAGLFVLMTWLGAGVLHDGGLAASVVAVALVAAGVALAVYVAMRRRGRMEAFAARIRPVAHASRLFVRPEGLLVAAVSVVIWLLQGLAFLAIGRSLSIELSLLEATSIIVLASIAALVPAAPGYVGTFDAGIAVGLNAVGVPGGAALGFILLVRIVMFVPVTIAGLLVLLLRYHGAGLTRRSRDRMLDEPDVAPPAPPRTLASRDPVESR
jgi:uncharacterized membrane protein YbhN (UPF0104 family)